MIEFAKKLAVEAGHRIMEYYDSTYNVAEKSDKSPLTQADLAANKIIVEGIKSAYAEHGILTEESEDDQSRLGKELVWIVDPLDGTKEFISRNGEFTVNIALVKNNRPIIGVIYAPAVDDLYFAEAGGGSWLNGKRINISNRNRISQMTLARSRSHASQQIIKISKEFKDTIAAGSSLKGCLVAKGEADVYMRLGPVHEWDICAMDVVVNEAGGILTDIEGNELRYNKKQTLINRFIVSNNQIHDKIIEKVKKVEESCFYRQMDTVP